MAIDDTVDDGMGAAVAIAKAAMLGKNPPGRREDAPFAESSFHPALKATAKIAGQELVAKIRSVKGGGTFFNKVVELKRNPKPGHRYVFAALVVVGDRKGRVGFGRSTASEGQAAIRKATESAERSLIHVSLLSGRTLHKDVEGRHGTGRVLLRPADPGTGIVAREPMRMVFDALGMHDVVADTSGLSNANQILRATFDALKKELASNPHRPGSR